MEIVIFRGVPKNWSSQLEWCRENFGDSVEVVGPTQAELYCWSWEIIGFGLRQLYFTDSGDHMLYLLRWG